MAGGRVGNGNVSGVLVDRLPLDAVQSSRPDPANEFLAHHPPNATARAAIATDQETGDMVGTGPWGRAGDDFRVSGDRLAGLPCGGRCPDGMYPLGPA